MTTALTWFVTRHQLSRDPTKRLNCGPYMRGTGLVLIYGTTKSLTTIQLNCVLTRTYLLSVHHALYIHGPIGSSASLLASHLFIRNYYRAHRPRHSLYKVKRMAQCAWWRVNSITDRAIIFCLLWNFEPCLPLLGDKLKFWTKGLFATTDYIYVRKTQNGQNSRDAIRGEEYQRLSGVEQRGTSGLKVYWQTII